MKIVCPKCNSTDVETEKIPDGSSNCNRCDHRGKTASFPIGYYDIPRPPLQETIDRWCDDMKVGKQGFFYKNASKMCHEVIDTQLKPWRDENEALKLLIEVLNNRLNTNFVNQALAYIEEGNTVIDDFNEDENGVIKLGQLILSYQHSNEDDECDGEDNSNAGQGSLQ
jgi:hypothetical protein